jgi:predicted ATPase
MPGYALGGLRLDADLWSLTLDGRVTELGPRAVRLLHVLVTRANECVSKTDLLEAAWPGLVVEEANLSVQMSAIRRVLREHADGSARVETLPRRGYRFVGTAVATQAPRRSEPPGNLPLPASTFIGRKNETSALLELLSGARVLTLLGSGGCGKTRLLLHVGAQVADRFGDGVFFAELAPLSSADSVVHAIAAALGVRETAGTPLAQVLVEHLRDKQLLLQLDNCEHLIDACADIAEKLTRRCPRLTILASSRQPLGIDGEQRYRVPSLSLPRGDEPADLGAIQAYESVQLFIDRARRIAPGLELTDDDVPALASICRHLDGIPLALELAASRTATMSLAQLDRRLDDRFQLLTGGLRTALPRQQTLRSLIDWSYGLLSDPEKTAWQRLAVFHDGWTLEAADRVGLADAADEASTLDLLTSLVDKCLVVEPSGPGFRYRMLETLRQYAHERLLESGQHDLARARHLDHYVELAEAAKPHLRGPEQATWLDRLQREHENLGSAIDCSLSSDSTSSMALRLCWALWQYWFARGHLGAGRRFCQRALDAAGADVPDDLRGRVLHASAALAYFQSDYAAARALHQQAVAVRRELGDATALSSSLSSLAAVHIAEGDFESAESVLEEGLALARTLGDEANLSGCLLNLGLVARQKGDDDRAKGLYAESLAIRRRLGSFKGIAQSLTNLAEIDFDRGDFAAAQSLQEESLSLMRKVGDRTGIATNLHNLGNLAYERGNALSALQLHLESLQTFATLGASDGVAYSLEGVAAAACALGDLGSGANLWGAAERLREVIGAPLPVNQLARYRRAIARARSARAGDLEPFDLAWQDGRRLTTDQASELAAGLGRAVHVLAQPTLPPKSS